MQRAIELRDVGIVFRLQQEREATLKESLFNLIRGRYRYQDFWALRGVNFQVEKGETLGIIGENGSGKTTLLKILAGIYQPDEGEVKVRGMVSALLELGAGFHEELTGRENIYLNGSLLGISREKINRVYHQIVEFSGLERFIDTPLKNYSSGMKVRLGFAIAAHVDCDVLLVDEVLAVGDEAFQGKCYEKIEELKRKGVTLVFVSHDMNAVRRLCDRVLLVHRGRLIERGGSREVIQRYFLTLSQQRGIAVAEAKPLSLVFHNGRTSLYLDDRELTRAAGLYSSIFSYDIWHDSTQAIWNKEPSPPNEIIVRGKWRRLPLVQHWRLKIEDHRTIYWEVEMECLEEASIKEFHLSLLLQDGYLEWFTPCEEGKFSPIDPGEVEWIQLNHLSKAGNRVGVKGIRRDSLQLPGITMVMDDEYKRFLPSALNTDFVNNSRVLQFLQVNNPDATIYQRGRYPIFKGRIIIEAE